ncbi:conserved Plasmodium protein, unknown function [Plasmodium ovale]|uniref:Uncharacterized protein n=2 Tax=Plasmodium ovale TaxID=36330 RepID=A0A1A8XCP7_PLAOA|nr:conserved Plasmodium protein, unknown function [Plasmodium ovale curtisi]SBT02978.1 conserved Plasmodium protein, unknown function [Plasmodium ovale curtisi]SCP04542.1 conserved Plasmodium protein, unknown function [Plasmodium ovale]
MPSSSLLLRAFILGSPFGALLFNEVSRIKNLRDDERVNKSLFLKNFHRNDARKKDRELGRYSNKEEGNTSVRSNEGDTRIAVNEKDEEEALSNYFYGKAWGYTTDYEIDLSLRSGDLIFVKHDLDNVHFFKRVMLKMNRYFHCNSEYDEIGIILKEHNISYVYIQNLLNGKEKLIRYSHFLQRYKPSVVSLRRFVSDDENLRKDLHNNILENLKKEENENNRYSIFLNLLYNLFTCKTLQKKSPERDCLCNNYVTCKRINANIDINNLMSMLLFRSFNLFFYFLTYINDERVNYEKRRNENVLLKNICKYDKTEGATIPTKVNKKQLPFYEFPISPLTSFSFISGDCKLVKGETNFLCEEPKREVQKEIENYLSLLVENEYTLMDSAEYMNKVFKEQEEGRGIAQKSVNINKAKTFLYKINILEKLFGKWKSRIVPNYHVYEIYRKTHLLPSVKKDDFPMSTFLCVNNFYTPQNPRSLLRDKFSTPKLSNLFHVRQEEAEKLQRFFFQFNRVPKS